MNDNQKPSDFVLLAAGVMTVIGSFCPWISVSFISVRGTDGWRGLVVIVAGIVVSVFAASRLWESLVKSEFKRRLNYLSIFSAVISIGVLSEVGFKTLKAASEIGNLNNSDELGLGDFGNALGDFSNSIASALKPKIAFGWYLSAFSLISAFVLIMLKMRKIENAPADVMHQKMEGALSTGTIVIKRKSLFLSLAALVLVVVGGLFLFSKTEKDGSNGSKPTDSSTAPKPYVASSQILRTSKEVSNEVVRLRNEWYKFGYAKYTVWADRFITMIGDFQAVAVSGVQLSYDVSDEFELNSYSNEDFILKQFKSFESSNSELNSALNRALQCSMGSPSNDECDPQFKIVATALDKYERITTGLVAMLD